MTDWYINESAEKVSEPILLEVVHESNRTTPPGPVWQQEASSLVRSKGVCLRNAPSCHRVGTHDTQE